MKKINKLLLLCSIAFFFNPAAMINPSSASILLHLNSNLLYDLTSNGFQRELASPS